MPHVSVAGVRVTTATRKELASTMLADCVARRRATDWQTRLVFDSNGHGVSLAARDKGFREAIGQADIIHADGGFIVLASKFLAGAPIAERSATTDLIHDFADVAVKNGLSYYLLGGHEAVNAACAERLLQLHPGLRIVGRHHGYFSADEEAGIVDHIARSAPDLLWIGLGKPREQMFAVRHRDRLGASWAITCGGCYNYVTGDYKRAPLWLQRLNLEWLHRAVTEPRTLLLRYLTTSPHAIWLALTRADRTIHGPIRSPDLQQRRA